MFCSKAKLFLFCIAIFIIGCNQKEIQIKSEIMPERADMKLTSPAFANNGAIPPEFTCDGSGSSPPLIISEVPPNAKSLALIMDDPDAPAGTWDHWIVFNIPSSTNKIAKGAEPEGIGGRNSWGRAGYGGPCPPSGTHRYFFKLYALDTELSLPEGATKSSLERAMGGHVISKTELIGTYKRR